MELKLSDATYIWKTYRSIIIEKKRERVSWIWKTDRSFSQRTRVRLAIRWILFVLCFPESSFKLCFVVFFSNVISFSLTDSKSQENIHLSICEKHKIWENIDTFIYMQTKICACKASFRDPRSLLHLCNFQVYRWVQIETTFKFISTFCFYGNIYMLICVCMIFIKYKTVLCAGIAAAATLLACSFFSLFTVTIVRGYRVSSA